MDMNKAEMQAKVEAVRRNIERMIDGVAEIYDPTGREIMSEGLMQNVHNAFIQLDNALSEISGTCPECHQRLGHKMDCSKR